MSAYSLGLDYGTNSVRAIVVDVADGREVGLASWDYAHGRHGILLDADPTLARQHPQDYIDGARIVITEALASASRNVKRFSPRQIIGIGVDTTGSTPLPIDANGRPLALTRGFGKDLSAMAWLWKDHTSVAQAAEITALAARIRPHYLAKCGGTYSSEWFFSKILHCLRTSPRTFDAAFSWVELADWIPAMLTGTTQPGRLTRGICGAGHKGMYNEAWGGYPDAEFLGKLDPKLAELRQRLQGPVSDLSRPVGGLTQQWADLTGLAAGTPVAVGAFDAHMGAIGCGIRPRTMVKIIGTSTCDIMLAPMNKPLVDVPGLCGIVPGSVLPGYFGLEAGQSGVGDIFNWFVNLVQPLGQGGHETLTRHAAKLKPGESGLLALDWNNGNRTILVDQRLTGLLMGQTLHTTPAEIYRALIEATAFGALTIINRFEEYGLGIAQVVMCGGIAEKNPLVMQIYADVFGRNIKVSRSSQTCALGAAIAAAVVAGAKAGGYDSFKAAQQAMATTRPTVYRPDRKNHEVYKSLFVLYSQMHDAMGTQTQAHLFNVMKDLLAIRQRAMLPKNATRWTAGARSGTRD